MKTGNLYNKQLGVLKHLTHSRRFRLGVYGLLSLMLTLSACRTEEFENVPREPIEGTPMTLDVKYSTRAFPGANPDDDGAVDSLRIAILDDDGTNPFFNQKYPGTASNPITINTYEGVRDVYVFANEPAYSRLGTKRGLSDSLIYLDSIVYTPTPTPPASGTDFNRYKPTHIPMISRHDNTPLAQGTRIDAQLKRRMSKLDITINYTEILTGEYATYWLRPVKMQVVDLPEYYFWVDRDFDGNQAASEVQLLERLSDGDFTDRFRSVFYVPSYKNEGNSHTAKVKLFVERRLKGSAGSEFVIDTLLFACPINNSLVTGENPNDGYSLSPNYKYTIQIPLTDSDVNSLPLNMTVAPWDSEDVEGNPHEQYQIEIVDGLTAIPHNYTEHPLRYVNETAQAISGGVPFDFATIARKQLGSAPLPATTPLTVELKAKVNGVATTTGFALQHANGTNNGISNNKYTGTIANTPMGFRVNITDARTYEFEYIVTMGNLTHHSNPFFLSRSGTGNHMFNSNEIQRFIDMGGVVYRDEYYTRVYFVDSDGKEIFTSETDPGTGDFHHISSISANRNFLNNKINFFNSHTEMPNWDETTTYTFWFSDDNSRPVWWDEISGGSEASGYTTKRYTGANPYTDYRAIPRFRDKVMDVIERSTGKVFIRIKQARPYYYGYFADDGNESVGAGNHKIAAGYNGYDDNVFTNGGDAYYKPKDGNNQPYTGDRKMTRARGSYFSMYLENGSGPHGGGLAGEYARYWRGDGMFWHASIGPVLSGWNLPKAQLNTTGTSGINNNEIYKMYDRCFKGGPTGSIDVINRHYNDDVVNEGSAAEPRINFLPKSSTSYNNNNNQGRYYAGRNSYSYVEPYHLYLFGNTVAIYKHALTDIHTTGMSVRVVRNVK